MKAVVAVLFALVIAGAGWLGWTKYQASQETKEAILSVRVSATQTERQLKARMEDGITFAEYFKRGSSVMDRLDQEESRLQTRQWKHRPEDRDTAIEFIEQCKSIVRSDQSNARLIMEQSNAQSALDQAEKEYDQAVTSYAIEWASKQRSTASDNLIEVLNKLIKNTQESEDKIKKMLAADDSVKAAFGQEVGLSSDMVGNLKAAIEPSKAKEKQKEG
ncbi:hypothetical protein N0609_30440 [Pseudomonas aeruginosa]|uniref:hypothetical protein n=1 Tax=Pseudomonas aeruginosa TaxID=287 RepID=UPI000FF2E77A|nr:hypothetical protein [Pseudomonas aeruginosa]MCD2825967.1 hypothetical protein [Pseudomonas aeruginosa]MCD2831997.1 hypothetical protein [Pseudomonas aeruginosa]MCS7530652.1 hypothetical protein [Pseudomonas aeruginosa]MCS7693485.1 hypothetical protein [Pseudomonas aeruginosa]MCS7713420.1 hypothetical protein [Pseudomonas aeruginosa]